MEIAIRKFQEKDIPYKVNWINDESNNKYLHYDLPLKIDKTMQWFRTLEGREDRVDYTITLSGDPVGLIGLLNIDRNTKDAELYICLGDEKFKGKGIAQNAIDLLIKNAHKEFGLEKIYLYTEVENIQAQKLFEKVGFVQRKLIRNDLYYNGKYVDRYRYILHLENYFQNVGGV
jgi:RimJ/RimL family protein N-acetyltransferase